MLVEVTCSVCGCTYGMPDVQNRELRRTGNTFYCPSGHSQIYRQGPSEVETLKHKLEARELDIASLKKRLETERTRYRCIVAGCDMYRDTKSAMRKHLAREHQIREDVKRLPANAGKSAHNSDVT